MKIKNLTIMLFICMTAFASVQVAAQEKDGDIITQTLWYEVDLKDSQNQELFTRKRLDNYQVHGDLIYSLLQGVRAGILRPFQSDDLAERMTYEEFISRLDTAKLFRTQSYHRIVLKKILRFSQKQNHSLNNTYFSKMLWKNIENEEKQGKKVFYEIEAITILQENSKPLATFSFAEIATNILLDNPECEYWVSKEKEEKMNMFDALNHGLYKAKLFQYQDNENNKIVKVQYENDIQILKSKYVPYNAMHSKIAFLHTFDESDVVQIFKKYQLE